MTVLEAAKAMLDSSDGRQRQHLRRYLVAQIVDYLDRRTRYMLSSDDGEGEAWRNATPDEQDAAAEALLREVLP